MKQTFPSSLRRLLAFVLCMMMLLTMMPMSAFATETESATDTSTEQETIEIVTAEEEPAAQAEETPLAVVFAASDFQAENSNKTADSVSNGKSNMNAVIAQMQKAGYKSGTAKAVTGALFCGDYTANFNTWGSTSGATGAPGCS